MEPFNLSPRVSHWYRLSPRKTELRSRKEGARLPRAKMIAAWLNITRLKGIKVQNRGESRYLLFSKGELYSYSKILSGELLFPSALTFSVRL